QFKDNVILL
nr:Chain F, Nucleoprotein peptide [Severe acute respiratory syndrome-related coronavirus]